MKWRPLGICVLVALLIGGAWALASKRPSAVPASGPTNAAQTGVVNAPTFERRSAAETTFDGLWDSSFGRMRLSVDGSSVTGSYASVRGSKIVGTIDGDRLEFTYKEPESRGEGWFEMSEDCASLSGKWRAAGTQGWRGWSATRVRAPSDRVWLVILEAHWEGSLAEREYSFGEMLRSYFSMPSAQHVAVRQRMFHDEDDFRRFAAEVPFLPGPVVVLVSTHGTPEGIAVSGTTIGPDVIAESLSGASNIELLHLSGCSMMSGPAPRRIIEQTPVGQRFPVSGYSTVVAWDASALADFIYLTFLLVHRLEPSDAVRQAHRAGPFTARDNVPGSSFEALGLDVLVPSDL